MLVIDGVQIIINSVYEKELRKEIFEKIMFLLTLIKGTIPMNREIGMEADILDLPVYEAQSKYMISAIELIEEFETRVTVDEISFTMDEKNGKMIPEVVVTYNGE
jgi:hypothetical protein